MAYEQKHINGDAVVGHDAVVGGDLKVNGRGHFKGNVKIDGWLDCPNLASPHKGFFATEGELKAAYPSPQEGWVAVVGDNLPAGKVYRVENGKWINTNNDSTGSLNGGANAYSKQVVELASMAQEIESSTKELLSDVRVVQGNSASVSVEKTRKDGEVQTETIQPATPSTAGVMSARDKTNLDGSVSQVSPLYDQNGNLVIVTERNDGTYQEIPIPKATSERDGIMSKEDKQSLAHLPHAIEQEQKRALMAEKKLGEQIAEESNRAINHEAEIHADLGVLERKHSKDVEELTKKIEKAHCRIDQFSKPSGCKCITPAASIIYDNYNTGLGAKTVQEAIDMLVGGGVGGGGSADLTELREEVAGSVSSVGVNFGFADEVKIWHEKNNGETSSESIPAASQYSAGVMSKDDKKKLDSIVSCGLIVSHNGGPALNICDTKGNIIVRFSGGHIRTKFFDSRNYSTDTTPDDMSIKGTSIIIKDADFTDVAIENRPPHSPVPPEVLEQFAYNFPFTVGG